MFSEGRRASAKALRQGCVWHVQGLAMRPPGWGESKGKSSKRWSQKGVVGQREENTFPPIFKVSVCNKKHEYRMQNTRAFQSLKMRLEGNVLIILHLSLPLSIPPPRPQTSSAPHGGGNWEMLVWVTVTRLLSRGSVSEPGRGSSLPQGFVRGNATRFLPAKIWV